MMSKGRYLFITVILLAALLFPCVDIAWMVFQSELGPDPAKKLALITGAWSMRLLLCTLCISSLSRINPAWRLIVRWRRIVGVMTFFYAALHLLVFIALYLEFDLAQLFSELHKRPYITVGFVAWLMLLLLAVTSNNMMVKQLGATRWKLLHKLVYLVLLCAIIHVAWQVRASWFNAALYGFLGCLLLAERLKSGVLPWFVQKSDKLA